MIELNFGENHRVFKFPGGETHVEVSRQAGDIHRIRADLHNGDDMMELLLVTDALRRMSCAGIDLVMPYVPYGRQDRVANPGEALSLKVFCEIINAQKYDSVEVWDPHSDVTTALLNNVRVRGAEEFVTTAWPYLRGYGEVLPAVLVAPDAGAIKRVGKVASTLNMDMIRADKTRDTQTGKITGTVVYTEHIGERDFLIVDDILDGGRTFIELAKGLRPYTDGKIYLYVTHGIFSAGVESFLGLIDKIFVANLWPGVSQDGLGMGGLVVVGP